MEKCYLCSKDSFNIIHKGTRDDPKINVLRCTNCSLVFLDKKTQSVHYEDSKMHGNNLPSVSEWLNQTDRDDERRFNHYREMINGKCILDFGCGAGGFLLRASKITQECFGVEVEARIKNHYGDLLNIYKDIDDLGCCFDIVFAFHVFEHLDDPLKILEKIKRKLKPGGAFIVEVPHSEDALLTLYGSSEFAKHSYWSNHLFLFNQFTLAKIGEKVGLKLRTVQGFQRYPLANHLYWLAKGIGGGHKHWGFLSNPILDEAYGLTLGSIGKTDTIIGYFSVD
jgi:SAM-dependent methyltransferase